MLEHLSCVTSVFPSITVPTNAQNARLAWNVAKTEEGWYLAIDDIKVTGMSGESEGCH